MSDTLIDGLKLRTFNVLDDFNREGLAIDVELSLPSACVIRSLDRSLKGEASQQPYDATTVRNYLLDL